MALPTLKAENVVKPFTGGTEWHFWVQRFETVCRYQKFESSEDKANILSMYLDGPALVMFLQMGEDSKSFDKVKAAFDEAYTPDPSEAFELLNARRLRSSESIDEYYFDLVRLWRRSVDSTVAELMKGKEMSLLYQTFLKGLPTAVRTQLKVMKLKLDANVVLKDARSLVALLGHGEGESGVVGHVGHVQKSAGAKDVRTKGFPNPKGWRCARCGSKDHLAKSCRYEKPVCYLCFSADHLSSDCPKGKNVRGEDGKWSQQRPSGVPRH